ncbi:hypothetical protein SALBM135S_02352 [Streptomyces alboniger]
MSKADSGVSRTRRGRAKAKARVDPTALLAHRAHRHHRKAWAAVFAALALTSLLLGSFGLALASAGLGHARVERYSAADLVVAGDQSTRYTAKPWGSAPDGDSGPHGTRTGAAGGSGGGAPRPRGTRRRR